MDAMRWFAIFANFVLESFMRLLLWCLITVCQLLWWGLRKLLGKTEKRLPSGERVISYADGKEFVILEAKGGKSRHVPNTPELRQRLMEAKRNKSIFRRFRRS